MYLLCFLCRLLLPFLGYLLIPKKKVTSPSIKLSKCTSKMPTHLIMALSENDVIGVRGKLPWHIPMDLKWFKMNTYGSVVIMGRKTWDSLPYTGLPGRLSIVLSRQSPKTETQDCIFCRDWNKALDLARKASTNIYIIGGSEIFKQALLLKIADTLIITRVHKKINECPCIYGILPLTKTLKWQSKTFQYKKTKFHFELYSI